MNDDTCRHGHPVALVGRTARGACRECGRVSSREWSERQRLQLPSPKVSLADRFWAKVARMGPGDCWRWLAQTTRGYGRFDLGGRSVMAHRVAFELTRGPIPVGQVLDHLCRNRACVNPAHLEPTTQQVNILRGEGLAAHEARQTHCVRGHALTDDNVYRRPGALSRRVCRACQREASRRFWQQKRDASPTFVKPDAIDPDYVLCPHGYMRRGWCGECVPRGPLLSIGERRP